MSQHPATACAHSNDIPRGRTDTARLARPHAIRHYAGEYSAKIGPFFLEHDAVEVAWRVAAAQVHREMALL